MRVNVAEADSLIGSPIAVLDKGSVTLLDYMGTDASIVQSARTSYGPGTKTVNEDKGLINYLMRHEHWTPFEMVELRWHIKLPLFVFAQWVRHRTANVNSMSARYSEMPDEFYLPTEWRGQSQVNKQSSDGFIDNQELMFTECNSHSFNSYSVYQGMLEEGVSREMARMVLPQNLYTEIVWKCDLRNLFNFLKLRLDPHAQYEIQEYARALVPAVRAVAPVAYEAFENHILGSSKFSADEMEILVSALDESVVRAKLESLPKRRQAELLKKLKL